MTSAARQSIIVPTLMLSAWLLFRVTAHFSRETPVLAGTVPSTTGISIAGRHTPRPPGQASLAYGPTIFRTIAIHADLGMSSPWPMAESKRETHPKTGTHPGGATVREQRAQPTNAIPLQLEPESGMPFVQHMPEASESRSVSLQTPFENQLDAKPAPYREARLTGAGWMFFRSNGAEGVSSGNAPTLGGPQLGLRLNLALFSIDTLNVSGTVRASAPLGGVSGKEASAGVSISTKGVPGIRLFVERRMSIDQSASSAWSALASYGSEKTIGRTGLKARVYGEAGVVQSRQTNPFAFTRLELVRPISQHLEIGMETVADAQRRAYRIDIGPVVSAREFSHPNIVISAAWRLRAAGNAKPKSGPAITVSTSF
jgi:hypothetical protein